MITRRLTIIEMVILVIATVILFMALLTFSANAQELASSATGATVQHYKHEKGSAGINASSDNATKPYSDNTTMTKADILKQKGVPGKGIDQAPGLQKPFNPNAIEHAGIKKFLSKWHHKFQDMIRKYTARTSQEEVNVY